MLFDAGIQRSESVRSRVTSMQTSIIGYTMLAGMTEGSIHSSGHRQARGRRSWRSARSRSNRSLETITCRLGALDPGHRGGLAILAPMLLEKIGGARSAPRWRTYFGNQGRPKRSSNPTARTPPLRRTDPTSARSLPSMNEVVAGYRITTTRRPSCSAKEPESTPNAASSPASAASSARSPGSACDLRRGLQHGEFPQSGTSARAKIEPRTLQRIEADFDHRAQRARSHTTDRHSVALPEMQKLALQARTLWPSAAATPRATPNDGRGKRPAWSAAESSPRPAKPGEVAMAGCVGAFGGSGEGGGGGSLAGGSENAAAGLIASATASTVALLSASQSSARLSSSRSGGFVSPR